MFYEKQLRPGRVIQPSLLSLDEKCETEICRLNDESATSVIIGRAFGRVQVNALEGIACI